MFMGQLTKHIKNITRAIPKASQVLVDYEYWLKRRFGVTGSHLANAKGFLRTYRPGGDLISQLEDYASARSAPLRSVLGRFKAFIEQRGIYSVAKDQCPIAARGCRD